MIRVIAIFGDPIEHTLSPYMHNAAFKALSLEFVYVPFKVEKEKIGEALSAMKLFSFAGANITIPHKESVIEYLDEVDEMAKRIGAVNTLVNKDGRLFGYNTDIYGFSHSLKEVGFSGKKAYIIGAGGAARSVFLGLCSMSISEIYIFNRDIRRAKRLVEELSPAFPEIKVFIESFSNIRNSNFDTDIVINATSLGLNGENLPIPWNRVEGDPIFYDLIYNPIETPFIKEAKRRGYKAISGLDMLVLQGIESFRLWTGKKPPKDLMKKVVLEKLCRSGGMADALDSGSSG